MKVKVITKLSVTQDVALVTLNKVPANVDFICKIFDRLDEEGINVDMISQSPLTGSFVAVSFTTSSDSMVKVAALEQKIDDMTAQFRQNQLERMKESDHPDEMSVLYSEMLTDFERIGDHALNIAQALMPRAFAPAAST